MLWYGQDGTGRLVDRGWFLCMETYDGHNNINNTNTILTLVMAGCIISCVPTVCTVLGICLDMWRLEGELTEKWKRAVVLLAVGRVARVASSPFNRSTSRPPNQERGDVSHWHAYASNEFLRPLGS